jgi:hypothetical protein
MGDGMDREENGLRAADLVPQAPMLLTEVAYDLGLQTLDRIPQ